MGCVLKSLLLFMLICTSFNTIFPPHWYNNDIAVVAIKSIVQFDGIPTDGHNRKV